MEAKFQGKDETRLRLPFYIHLGLQLGSLTSRSDDDNTVILSSLSDDHLFSVCFQLLTCLDYKLASNPISQLCNSLQSSAAVPA